MGIDFIVYEHFDSLASGVFLIDLWAVREVVFF